MNENFLIKNNTRQQVPPKAGLLFAQIKKHVLGENYDLSLVFVGDQTSKKLNTQYRNKPNPTNILSFPISDDTGEIFINPHMAKKDAPKFKKRYNDFIVYLFVHGVLHLKGFDHGERMEKEEDKVLRKFGQKQN